MVRDFTGYTDVTQRIKDGLSDCELLGARAAGQEYSALSSSLIGVRFVGGHDEAPARVLCTRYGANASHDDQPTSLRGLQNSLPQSESASLSDLLIEAPEYEDDTLDGSHTNGASFSVVPPNQASCIIVGKPLYLILTDHDRKCYSLDRTGADFAKFVEAYPIFKDVQKSGNDGSSPCKVVCNGELHLYVPQGTAFSPPYERVVFGCSFKVKGYIEAQGTRYKVSLPIRCLDSVNLSS